MRRLTLLLATAMLVASCTPPDVPPPQATPQGDDRYLIDPLTGFKGSMDEAFARRFQAIWNSYLAGDDAGTRRRLAELAARTPDFPPALLVEAALEMRAGNYDAARSLVQRAQTRVPDYTAAQVYEAEIALRDRQVRAAYDLYRAIAANADAPATARERVTQLEGTLFQELFTAAQTTTDPAESVRLLREALTFQPSAIEPRLLLARRLVTQRSFDDARRELDPLLSTAEVDRSEVQELLAEIDVGRGRYQEAIVRYERLSRRTREPRHAARLEQIKEAWSSANLPLHVQSALDSVAITRADLAVLLYWTVPSVRFATNLGSPPIAVDVSELAGREEMIRAIAIGLYDVDPVTRRASPSRLVTAERLSRNLARLLTLRGAACARGVPADRVLAVCNVTDPLATWPADASVTGRDAEKILREVAGVLR